MNDTASYSFDATSENFSQYVINNSAHVPVLVDFWAPWCGPCQNLMPLLTRLAEEYGGQFLLAKVNIDEQPELATQFQVRSVPTVKLVRNGDVVDEFAGAIPEGQIREFIEPHLAHESDKLLPQIFDRFQMGEEEEALQQLRELKATEPGNKQLQIFELQMVMTMERDDEARQLIEAMPAELRESDEVKVIASQLELNSLVGTGGDLAELEQRIADNPADSEARYQLGLLRSAMGDYQGALDALLELLKRDRGYDNGAAQKAMLKVFDTLSGSNDELVAKYRRMMASALY